MAVDSALGHEAPGKIKVAIVYGGRSSEHEVSCVSAGAILSHLDPERFECVPVGITKDGVWTVGEFDPEKLRTVDRVMPQVELVREVTLSLNPNRAGEFRFTDGELYAKVDVIFPVLHGPYGEDGTVQGLFELSGVPYVGTGVLSSACGMDKEFTKKLLAAEGLPVGKEVILRGNQELTQADKDLLGLPVYVKPARGGSSIGISRVTSWEELPAAMAYAREYDHKVIVESEIVGEEVECGVLEKADGTIVSSVLAQLADTHGGAEGFYGFDTKYLDSVVTAHIPAPLDAETTKQVQLLAADAFRALNCHGLARVDFFVTANGPVLNEVNTMPGFTPISMYPKVMEASGIAYADLLAILIERELPAR
ncbi:D-alanine--D-alanine ligase [Corynebacterium sp. 153RC1]|uniref:D-alanine--D-alanine ligase family protein n=1 Tax=unclassified Corynebacterium TaxID=2624378 RepID=UPI00211CBE81|nr:MULTISPECIES: D-alanine--D-alanine ligase family protein [unclassified Corynebacterium]MCQ9370567.1 D-alanine--D-alanine ligase [Corynebacterium sp. 35RC1]MCQ9352917.1 D-alanine--D-alanine ligase [Corynebacterium sp. 209RC1]MCQ9353863.1 D-alanine--D-alanine ligase [Corynebacterium sp. 1222RC1]MCQ9356894.1 D-alanine--D-alanine ligase [Corynebacterium sp. 122RC1]MCQ9358255.1 D-alanine--D-alanine ligase [Corynebacterium sp. 142RC1]